MDGFVPPDDMDSEKYSKVDDRIEALPELEKRKIIEQSWQHIFDVKKRWSMDSRLYLAN